MGNPDLQLKDDPEAYMDTCSGTIPFKEREMGGLVYNLAKQGKVDEIRVSRLDRLGRDTIDILTTLKELTKMKVNVYSKQEGINTGSCIRDKTVLLKAQLSLIDCYMYRCLKNILYAV